MTSVLPKPGTELCPLDDLPDPGAKGFYYGTGSQTYGIIVVRRGDKVYGYLNACPHQMTPLEMLPDRFFTRDKRHLLCTTHGAQFEPDTGRCISGPCKGASLKTYPLAIKGGVISVAQTIPGE